MEGDTQSFVVRIWHEATDSEGKIVAWRGFVDHVGSAKRLYFYDLDKIARFIQQEAGLSARQSVGERSSRGISRFAGAFLAFVRRFIVPKGRH